MSTNQQETAQLVGQTTTTVNDESNVTKPTKNLSSVEIESKQVETAEISPECEYSFDVNSFFSGQNINEIMNTQGPIVKSVLLMEDGTMKEVMYNCTPKLNQITDILNGSPSIVGQWESLGVIIVSKRELTENDTINKNELRFPFNNKELRGPLFLYRVDSNGCNKDFTLNEYKVFLSKKSEDIGKVWNTEDSLEIESGEIVETTDETTDETTNEEESLITLDFLDSQARETICKQFNSKYGRDPTNEELEVLSKSIMNSFFEKFGGLDDTETEDPTYIPEEEEEEVEEDEEDEIDEVTDVTKETTETTETVESKEDSEFAKEFEDALQHIRELAVRDSKTVLEKAKQNYKDETGEECDEETLVKGFQLLKMNVLQTEENEVTEEVPETEEQVVVIEEEEEEEEVETPLSEEEIRKEIAEAFEIVKECGRVDGQKLAEMVANTYYEINGREADLNEMSQVFGRLKERLMDEIKDDITSLNDVSEEEKLDTIITNLPKEKIKTINETNNNNKKELLKYSKSIVTQQMANEAKVKFVETIGREPTLEEFNSLLISLATTRFIEADYSGNESDDSDYNPNDINELQQQIKDIKEDTIDSNTKIDLEDCRTVLSNVTNTTNTSTINTINTSNVVKKPIAFFSPIGGKKTKKTKFNYVRKRFFEKGMEVFRTMNRREPTEEEMQSFKSFLSINNLPIEEPIEPSKENNLMENLDKLENEYNSENDSEYIPEKDETCNVNEDYEEVTDQQLKEELIPNGNNTNNTTTNNNNSTNDMLIID